jgi:hypothetical protein
MPAQAAQCTKAATIAVFGRAESTWIQKRFKAFRTDDFFFGKRSEMILIFCRLFQPNSLL